MQIGQSQEIEMRKIAFCLRGEIDKTTLHKKLCKRFAEDGQQKAYAAGGRKPPTISVSPVSVPSLTAQDQLTSSHHRP
jgi:hypothetical protein